MKLAGMDGTSRNGLKFKPRWNLGVINIKVFLVISTIKKKKNIYIYIYIEFIILCLLKVVSNSPSLSLL